MSGNKPLSHPAYRPDIDGLRAVAIVLVVIFHAFPTWIRGGFIGVDIFFVISGYLISTNIFENLRDDTFSFPAFYARRIRRIFPALILVLAACYIAGWLVLLADEYKLLGKHIFGGAAFVANVLLWRETGYFDVSGATKPLLHLWSLAIEEQYYILWPFLVWFAWKFRLNILTGTILLCAISFAFNIRGITADPTGTFYSPVTRAWELLVGGLLAWAAVNANPRLGRFGARLDSVLGAIMFRAYPADGKFKALSNLSSLAGLALIAFAAVRLKEGMPFPGKWAVLPVLGAVLVIAAGRHAWLNRVMLSSRPAVAIGLISYPLYLWHWPLLSFATIIESHTSTILVRCALVGLSLVLAAATYLLVERPLRSKMRGPVYGAILVFGIGLVGAAGLATYLGDGFAFRNEDRVEFSNYFENSSPAWHFSTDHKIWEAYREECNFYDLAAWKVGSGTTVPVRSIDPSCTAVDQSKSRIVFVWGDSHAEQLNYGITHNLPNDWQVLQIASSSCSASLGPFADPTGNYCDRSNTAALDFIKDHKPDVVVVGQREGHNAATAETINSRLIALGVKKVVFTGPVPHWSTSLPKLIARQLWITRPERTFVGIDPAELALNQQLKNQFAARNLNFVDATSVFCNGNGCLTRLGNDVKRDITTQDYGHLLPIASSYLASQALIDAIVN